MSRSTKAQDVYSTVAKLLVEGAGRQQFVEHGLRHRRAGLGVQRIFLQNLRHFQPVLVKLRRQFDEVARHRGAGEQRIGHVRQQAMQAVAEFVKQSAGVVEGQQSLGSPLAGLEKLQTLRMIGRTSPVSFS